MRSSYALEVCRRADSEKRAPDVHFRYSRLPERARHISIFVT